MYKIKQATKFKKDFKKIINNTLYKEELKIVLSKLQNWKKLEEKYKNHILKGEYSWFMECHVKPDLLLIYKISNDELFLYLLRLWSHSELF